MSRRARIGIAGVTTLALAAGLLAVPALREELPGIGVPDDEDSVATTTAQATSPQQDPTADTVMNEVPAEPVWPIEARTEITADGSVSLVGGLPITVTAKDTSRQVEIATYSQDTSATLGIDGVIVRIGDTGGEATTTIGYGSFANAFGADWQVRLRLTRLPECALTTPGAEQCIGTPLASTNNSHGKLLAATVPGSTLIAVTAAASGASGDYAATPLTSSGGWSTGGSTGDFTWSYAVPVPTAWTGGPGTQVSLGYSSSSVDGRTAASNNQPSWIGEGFDYEPGFIERKYIGCSTDKDNGNNTEDTGDLCWFDDNAFLSYGGTATELVKDTGSGTWRPKKEDGTRIERKTGGPNGDDNGEYWLVTLANGTKLWFGLNQLPGWTEDRPVTNSVFTVPVFGNQADEPCHDDAFTDSDCDQAWRWQLDYVEDVRGNTTSYWYTVETNKYARNLDPEDAATYVRSGHLSHIDYGTRSNTAYGKVPNRIDFTVTDRCLSSCDQHKTANWPDTPWDQECKAAPCTDNYTPTFWTTKRLTTVTTKQWTGSVHSKVDEVVLRHSFRNPNDGSRAGLFLEGITRTGYGKGGASQSVPEITFAAAQLPNRVDGLDNAPAMNWFRLSSIITETGGEILVDYSDADCVAETRIPAEPGENTWRCFPVYWNPAEYGDPELDWFHKYVVDSVSQIDHSGGGSPRTIVRYDYEGDAAWRYDDTNGLTEKKYRTWNQWRGYERVTTELGDAADTQPLSTVTIYHRGMDGDKDPGGGEKSVTTRGSDGIAVPDVDELVGRIREQRSVLAATGETVTKQFVDYWISKKTASRTIEGRVVEAKYVAVAQTLASSKLNEAGEWRTTGSAMSYNDRGQPVLVHNIGDVDDESDNTCVRHTYLPNVDKGIVDKVSMTETYGLPCAELPATLDAVVDPRDVYAVMRFSFDNQAHGSEPVIGDTTYSDRYVEWTSTGPRFEKVMSATFDGYGRPLTSSDATGATSKTKYVGATDNSYLGSVVHTNALGFTQTIKMDLLRGQALTVTDANGYVTTYEYDPLGRKTKIWLPGRETSKTPNLEYVYELNQSGPSVVATKTLIHNEQTVAAYTLYDSHLRQRQIQAPGANGGRIVSDVFYDSVGRPWKTYAAYHDAEKAPGSDLAVPDAEQSLPRVAVSLFDDYGRTTDEIFYSSGTEKWRTHYVHFGDRTDVIPPQGGTVTSTFTDIHGRVTEYRQFHGPTAEGEYDETTYTYDDRGNLASWQDEAGNTWSSTYDELGRIETSTDPDYGTSTFTYDKADRPQTVSNALHTLAYTYDELGRPTSVRDGTVTGQPRVEYTYDTVPDAKGLLASATRWHDGKAYTSTINDYDENYRPLSTSVIIPDGHGDLSGTYTSQHTYNVDGSPLTSTYPAAGGLPEETVKYHYDELGLPDWLGTNYPGLVTYVLSTGYTNAGQLSRLESAGAEEDPKVIQTFGYEPGTQRLASHAIERPRSDDSFVSRTQYQYDQAGNITKIADYGVGAEGTLVPEDVQCFDYDQLKRLTEAWTPEADDCGPAPATNLLGGAAPYWQQYTFDSPTGNRATLTENPTPTNPVKTTTAYEHTDPEDNRPHTLDHTDINRSDSTGTVRYSYQYDEVGNTIVRPSGNGKLQALAWTPEDKLDRITDVDTGEELASYIYGPDGSRLIAEDASGETLYLGSTEIHDSDTTAPTAKRYYFFAGRSVGVRTTQDGLTWLVTDHHGTSSIALSQDTLTVQHRRQDPYGNPRGEQPTAWPDKKGFVGGDIDPTGLTHVGAREYDPTIGRFISDDPITTGDPQQANGYTYANSTPITASDPSGLALPSDGPGGGEAGHGWDFCFQCLDPGTANEFEGFYGGVAEQAIDAMLGYLQPLASAYGCLKDLDACGQAVLNAVNYVLNNPNQFIKDALYGIIAPIADPIREGDWGKALGAATWLAVEFIASGGIGAIRKTLKDVLGAAFKKLPGDGSPGKSDSPDGTDPDSSSDPTGSPESDDKTTDDADEGEPEPDGSTEGGGDTNGKADDDGGHKCNCFVEGTPVSMADGTTKSIEEVEPGDEVTTYNTETGEQESHTVTALFHKTAEILLSFIVEGTDEDDRTHTGDPEGDTVSGADPPPPGTSNTFTVTPEHPFWQADTQTWTLAGDLQVGDQLLQRDGDHITITAIATLERDRPFTVYNFTVDGNHNYYATTVDTLVHNCSGTAKVSWDPDERHAYIEVSGGGMSVSSHALPRDFPSPDGGWDNLNEPLAGGVAGPNAIVVELALPNAGSAIRFIREMMDDGDPYRMHLAPYSYGTNDCISYCASVLYAGGLTDFLPGAVGTNLLRSLIPGYMPRKFG